MARQKSERQIRLAKIESMKATIKKASEADMRKVFIPLIMDNQTHDEKENKTTSHANGIGLSAAHAPQITMYGELVEKGFKLFPVQVQKAREILSHYAGQFVDYAAQTA